MGFHFIEPSPLPPVLGEKLRRILNAVSVAPRSEKRSALITAARRVSGEVVGPHYSLAAAADRLQETAEIHGIIGDIGQDAVQYDLAKALEDPLLLDENDPLFSADGTSFDVNAELSRLAILTVCEYERERRNAAERLNMRASILDRLVEVEREKSKGDGRQGRPLNLPQPKPWPEAVKGTDLLEALSASVRRYVVMTGMAADACALWVLHTFLLNCFGISPRLAVTSPEKGCGKTTLLDVLANLVMRPLPTANATASVVFRVVEMMQPTLLIDEADTFLSDKEELRGILNSGHRRGGAVIRSVGEDFQPRVFSTYSACAIALIGKLPPTLADRSVSIELRRRRSDEPIETFRFDRVEHLDELARKAMRWAQDNEGAVRDRDPDIPAGVHNRVADNWRPLLAIADVVGGEWGERARRAIGASVSSEQSIRTLLLGDIRAIFSERGLDRMASAELVDALVAIEGRPWAEWGKSGKPITANGLARMLAPFAIVPDTMRLGDRTPKGYHLAHFDDVFSRYLQDRVL